jgi:hypothetical protein
MPRRQPPSDPTGNLSAAALAVLAFASKRRDAVIPAGDLDGPARGRERDAAIGELVAAGLLARWSIPADAPLATGYHGPAVTFTPRLAAMLKLRMDRRGANWVAAAAPEKNPRVGRKKLEGGVEIVTEADMEVDPPGVLDRFPDRPYQDEPIEEDQEAQDMRIRALREERQLGLRRPTLILLGCQPWTPGNDERAPGAHQIDPADDPRNPPGDATARKASRRRPTPRPPCPVCGDRPLRSLVSLVPVKLGKNRAEAPPEIVDGGEYCGRCSRIWNDSIWPRVTKPDADGNGNNNANGKK